MEQYEPVANRPKTLFVDIDGVIFRQNGRWPDIDTIDPKKDLLPGVRERFLRWEMQGCRIILATGRADNFREITERQLREAGIPYHHLIMGRRILINNTKHREPNIPTAVAVNLVTDEGMETMEEP